MREPPTAIDVLLLAAGFGTRLAPLTLQIPKALLPICGLSIIDYHLAQLASLRAPVVERIVVNGHHLAAELLAHLRARGHRGDIAAPRLPEAIRKAAFEQTRETASAFPIPIAFSYEPAILGTGGALVRAAEFLRSEPFVIMNADTLFRAPLEAAIRFHRATDCAATMVLLRGGFWPNVIEHEGRVTAIVREGPQPGGCTFTGLHIGSQSLLSLLPPSGFHDIRDTYERLIERRELGAFVWDSQAAFVDIGTPESYLEAHRLACAGGSPFEKLRGDASALGLETAQGGRSADEYGFVDARARIGEGASIAQSVILGDAAVAPGAEIVHSILGPGARAEGRVHRRMVTTLGDREMRIEQR
ncbi:MAG: NTP transferase domain-containing protein [Candidatus Eisenbacteria bacterium]|nr:NTP transferase domain-containing protein [Candidatus Eisenbacteria bacterium]